MRLIDADKRPCKECLREFHCNNTYCAEFEEWLQKPVYDIDRVAEELKDLGTRYCTNVSCNNECEDCEHGILMRRAIEIVKQGLKENK